MSTIQGYGEIKLDNNHLKVIKSFQDIFPEAALTGTCSLLLFGFDLGRSPSDIDFIMPAMPKPITQAGWHEIIMPPGFSAKGYSTRFLNTRIEVIVWDEWEFRMYKGIKVTKLENLLEAKRDLGMTGTVKHVDDFYKIIMQLLTQRDLEGSPSAGVWVKASERLPKGNLTDTYFVKQKIKDSDETWFPGTCTFSCEWEIDDMYEVTHWLSESPSIHTESEKDLIIAGLEEGSELWKAEYDNCLSILKELVYLKTLKDSKGKTEEYEQRQPLTWIKAKKFLEKYQHM